ncbi:hypothetical protein C5748_03185 [Phyllobacterium phragmitis]|uniref:Uncharacterized protein n=1 Tax=Phyllobacterium phragmitis TaxID=2670329 RepID=A0A2S9IXI1_9HYPH|nr:hypothetical protein C5748_03185 [Phyllobacterium phragmitis]
MIETAHQKGELHHETRAEVYDTFKTIVCGLSGEEQRSLFFTTANKTYRLGCGETRTLQDKAYV